MKNIKIREFKDKNYKAIYMNGKTMRIAIDNKKPILELDYPEFLDVKLTEHCNGQCPYCYMSSNPTDNHYDNVIQKIQNYFGKLDSNQKPFQVAIGGGEPTSSPDFSEALKTFYDMNICPNYTTNGMWIQDKEKIDEILNSTKKYCGGIAISCHPHLKTYWQESLNLYYKNDIKINLHIIISDKQSIDDFIDIFNKYEKMVDYFVLLPLIPQGRAKETKLEWDYFIENLPNTTKIAFGAKFYEYLKSSKDFSKKLDISLYEPEILSKFLDLKDMSIYNSSFSMTKK